MKKYCILQYWNSCSEEEIINSGGWFQNKYREIMSEDMGDICETPENKDEAYKQWFNYYSGTEFGYMEYEDIPQWECYFYVLCEYDDETAELNILEESCGDLTVEEIYWR